MAVLLLCSVSVHAHDFEVDGIYYNKLTYNTVEVTFKGDYYNSYSNEYSGNVVIPSKVTYNSSTYTVKSIGKNAFCSCSALTSISMPTTITKIDEYAFQLCTGLTNIVIPSSVTTIAYGAFIDCTGLLSATIPSSVTTIESRAFSYCSNLEKVTMANGVTKIGDYAFYLCEKLNELTLSNNIIEIGKEAFAICKLLTEIILPEPLTTMGTGVFSACNSLKTIYIPNKVTTIPTDAFQNCYNLETVILGKSVTTIEQSAFYNCNIKTVIKYSSLTIDSYDLNRAENIINVTDLIVSNNLVFGKISSVYNLITYLGKESDLTLPNYCTGTTKYIIGSDAFSSSTTLKSVSIPSTVTSIGASAFKSCSSLESITIPSSVKTIGNDAFKDCKDLTEIELPASLESINEGAFLNCSSLGDVKCMATTAPILSGVVFEGVNYINCELQVPAEAITNYVNTENEWAKFRFINNQIIIKDGKESNFSTTNRVCDKITYTRNLPNLYWNPLYVPFEIEVEDITDKYEVAYINAVHSYDKDDDGEIDELEMEVVKAKAGTMKANYPYLIKARNDEAKSVNVSVEGATLYASTEKTLDCSSVYQKFEITGSYSRKSSEELSGKLAISLDGAWQPIMEGSYLNPFRLYLSITNRDDSPLKVNPSALSRVRIVEDGMTTGIIDLSPATLKDNVIYDLSGRKVSEPRKGQLYIVNGKKVIY